MISGNWYECVNQVADAVKDTFTVSPNEIYNQIATVQTSACNFLSNVISSIPVSHPPISIDSSLLVTTFSLDFTMLSVGHEDGYALYSLKSLEHLEKVHEGKSPQRVYVVERLFGSSLITLVSMEQSRKLSVYHYQKNNEICSHGYSSAILSVRLNRKRVIVCLEESIHVHNIMDMRLLHVIKDTPSNPLGLLDLSADEKTIVIWRIPARRQPATCTSSMPTR
ncbi:hypothetical protein M3Y96_00187700 [Aphelenchoides besseyi]|nr:hypothetical protein M3Y96_00187700 [Aphelenchoides besseyi]